MLVGVLFSNVISRLDGFILLRYGVVYKCEYIGFKVLCIFIFVDNIRKYKFFRFVIGYI